MAAEAGAPRLAAPDARVPLARRVYGFGSVFGKTLRDSRLAVLVVASVLGGLVLAGGASMVSAYATTGARAELAAMTVSLPPVMRGLYGNPVNVGTLGGFVNWHYGPYVALLASLWSILALSGTLAGEARRGSLEFTAVTPPSRARIALEKVGGHIAALAIAAAALAATAWLTGTVFERMPGDAISPEAAIGFAVGVGVKALMAGSVAFALASFTGRGAAAGVAGALMLAGYVLTSYRAVIPVFDAIAPATWFAWTAGHVPLAGGWDWGGIGLTAAVAGILLAIGVVAFARRDIAIAPSTRTPELPGALLGVRGPLGRSFGEVLPTSLAWAIGLGLFGLVMAAATRSFVDEILDSPDLLAAFREILPGADLTTPAGFLEFMFVDMGYVLIGLAAATLVAQRWGDEAAGRLDLELSTPLSRARWAVTSGIAVWLGIAVITALLALAVGAGIASSGGDPWRPAAGTMVPAVYGMALAGVGFALGGLVRGSIAGTAVALIAIATFLVDVLGPALDLPESILQLALTAHLGQPMVGSWDAGGTGACLALAAGGLAVGALGLRRRDLAA